MLAAVNVTLNPGQFRWWARWVAVALFLVVFAPWSAGGGPFNTLVVVNTNSPDSVELGETYAAAHGIPAHHVCRLGLATNLISITSNEFRSLLLDPIRARIAAENLADQIDFLVLCQDFPTRVRNVEGVGAALFYGFKNAPAYNEGGIGCNLPNDVSNAYFRAERAFRSAAGWNSTNGFIAFHLIGSDLDTAKAVAARGAAAQASFPAAAIYLYMLGSQYRSVRERLYSNAQFSFTALPGLPVPCVLGPHYTHLSGKTNVVGYQDGYGYIETFERTNNVWLPGAFADHLTSCAGMVPDPCFGQSTVLDWLDIGATASYGTVAEPCNYLEKFPDPLMAFYYARGFTVGEAYAMSVAAPYQGLFAGDPLAAPFAAPPATTVSAPLPGQIVTGTVPVQVSAGAHSNGVPAAALDLYLDGRFLAHLAALGPTPGNVLSVVVGDRTHSAAVAPGATLFDAVAALAAAVNADSNHIVSATATGDRLELIYQQFDHAGDHASVSAAVAQGDGVDLTLGVGLAATHLVPSVYPARKRLWISETTGGGGANANDTLTCIVTLTNGVAVTNVLVASQGEKITNLLERLLVAINTHPTLMATNGVRYDRLAFGAGNLGNDGTLFARTPGPDGAGIQIDFAIAPVSTNSGLTTNANFSGFCQDSPNDLRSRAAMLFHVRPASGRLEASLPFDTAALPDGRHVFDFIARDGSAVAAQSRLTLPFFVGNSSPQLVLLGTDGAALANDEPPDLERGTDFGRVAAGQARTNVFALRNDGPVALTVTNWTTNGTGADAFRISGIPATIEAGGVSNFAVVFAPADGMAYSAALRFDSDALVPQTNLLIAGTGFYALTVASEHGTVNPPAGITTNFLGDVLTNSVSAPAPAGGTQLVCNGWALTGHDPASGTGTDFTMTVTNHAELTWLWGTNYWLAATAAAHGSIDVSNSWQAAGATTQIAATADAYYHFTEWTGTVSATDNPLGLLMDAPQAVHAHFAENLAAQATPEWWLADHGWTNDFDAAALADAEPDGYPTWQEFVADTDPNDADSFPRVAAIAAAGAGAFVAWPASTGRTYQIHFAEDLVAGPWFTQQLELGTGEWTDTNPPPATGRYYRIAPQLP